MRLLDEQNVREASLFPRDVTRLEHRDRKMTERSRKSWQIS